jgi:Abortive infection C-terminus
MPDERTSDAFVMHGARAAAANGIPHIEAQIAALELSVIKNPGLAFDLAKFIVESTCKTILNERKIDFDKKDSLPRLFKAVTTNVPMLPVEASREIEARRKLLQTLNGLHTALHGVCELRNSCGFTSHGAEAERPAMEGIQAVLAAQAADAIVGFLFSAHRVQRVGTLHKRSGHDPTIDSVLDSVYDPVLIAGQPYAVSDALYATDREAYLAVAATVEESRNVLGELSTRFAACLKPDLRAVSFVHYADTAYLKTSNEKGEVTLEDTSFVSDGAGKLVFSPARSPNENADLLVQRFDPYSIINCFDLFTGEAAARVAEAYGAGTLDSLYPPLAVAGEAR